MAQFRSKPKLIEATQWHPGDDVPGVAYDRSYIGPIGSQPAQGRHYVVTIHDQRAYLDPGDWIVTEPTTIDGQPRYYLIKPEIFRNNYEPA